MNDDPPSRPDILIRPLAVDDWQDARAARLTALAESPYAFGSTLAREQAFDDEVWRSRAGSGWTFGAFDGATIIGLATGMRREDLDGPEPDSATDRDQPGKAEPEWHLVGMWVAPSYRGAGVGDRLVDAVCERARVAGAATITLWVTEMNGHASALYKRHGFSPTGQRELVRPEEPDNWELLLERLLR